MFHACLACHIKSTTLQLQNESKYSTNTTNNFTMTVLRINDYLRFDASDNRWCLANAYTA